MTASGSRAARKTAVVEVKAPVEIPLWEQELYRILRVMLGVADVGVNPKTRTIWLMGPASKLEALTKNAATVHFNLRRMGLRSVVADTRGGGWVWDYLEYAVLAALRDAAHTVATRAKTAEAPSVLAARWDEDERGRAWSVFPVPAPGGPQQVWWSAKQGRWMPKVAVPDWRVCIETESVGLGTNFGPVALGLPGGLPPLFVTHGVDLDALPTIERCGGMLWPSLAVSWRVPASFGEVVFFADVRVLAEVVAKRGRMRHLFLSETDAWSPTARDLLVWEKAVGRELRADPAWWQGELERDDGGWGRRWLQSDLLASWGKRPDAFYTEGGLAPENAGTPVTSWKKLVARVRKTMAEHTIGHDPYVHPQRAEWDVQYDRQDVRYPYMELKVRARVHPDAFVACTFPAAAKRRVDGFLDRVGFGGWRIPVKTPVLAKHERNDASRRAWSEATTRAVLRWAEAPCLGRGAPIPPRYRLATTREVDPADLWSARAQLREGWSGASIEWRRGTCYERVR